MFVMLSVHTTTTVRERQADPVNNSKVNSTSRSSVITTENNIFNNNNNYYNSKKQNLKLNLNNFENKNQKNNCVKISTTATDQFVNLNSATLTNGTSILTPSKLSEKSTNLPPTLVLTQLNNYKIPPTVQVIFDFLKKISKFVKYDHN